MPNAPAIAQRPRGLGSMITAPPLSRFAGVPALAAAAILALVAILVLAGALSGGGRGHAAVAAPPGMGDLVLYKTIDRRVAAGENYYAAAAAEQRANHYPLRPFVAVRLPTLSMLHAWVGTVGARLLLLALVGAAFVALCRQLRLEFGSGRYPLYGGVLAAFGLAPMLAPDCIYWHEAWAAVLVALAMALRSRDHWAASVLLGLAAVLVRELALPFLVVMAVCAWVEGARREAAAWFVAIATFALALGLHALALAPHLLPTDLHSQGWTALGGWSFVVQVTHEFTCFAVLPTGLAASLLPLALLGWAGWRGPFGRRGALLIGGYAVAFMAIGRPDNDYWGLMMAPLLPFGLLMVPATLRDLVATIGRSGSAA